MPAAAHPSATIRVDRLDEPVRLLSARLWAGFAALALVIAAVVVWGLVATLPQHVSGRGVILHGSAAVTVRAPAAGSLSSLAVATGTRVRRGQVLGTLAVGERRIKLRATVTGTVMSLLATPGSNLAAGAPLVTIDAAGKPARAVLFVSSSRDLARLAPGQRVDIGGATSVHGHVRSVSPYPVSTADLVTRFGTAHVPGLPADGGPVWLVEVSLDEPAGSAPALTQVSASVLVERVHPYQLVVGG